MRGRAPLCQGEKEGKLRAGDKGSETRGGKAERYNVMNLFMQYNLAHSDYNSAKFNWIVYSLRSRYDQSKREPRPALLVPTSFLFHPFPYPLVAEKQKRFHRVSSEISGMPLKPGVERGDRSSSFGSRTYFSSISRFRTRGIN